VADEPNQLYPEYSDEDMPGMAERADFEYGETDADRDRFQMHAGDVSVLRDGKWIPLGVTEDGAVYEVEPVQFERLSEAIAQRTITMTFEMPMDGTTWDFLAFLMGDETVRQYREEYYAELAWESEGGAIR